MHKAFSTLQASKTDIFAVLVRSWCCVSGCIVIVEGAIHVPSRYSSTEGTFSQCRQKWASSRHQPAHLVPFHDHVNTPHRFVILSALLFYINTALTRNARSANMRDSNICPHADELPCAFKPSAATNNHVHASRWSSRIRAITDSYAYPLPPSNMSIRLSTRRFWSIHALGP
jgi:hypothetical protein